jgi:UDP:flavonoid glycosyltransferase YjiC (YdhE family)
VLGALGHGRPVVVLPQAADQFSNGERVAAAGAGLALGAGPVAPDALRDAVRAVLRDASYRRAAEAVAAEIAAMPSPGAAIDRVVALAG